MYTNKYKYKRIQQWEKNNVGDHLIRIRNAYHITCSVEPKDKWFYVSNMTRNNCRIIRIKMKEKEKGVSLQSLSFSFNLDNTKFSKQCETKWCHRFNQSENTPNHSNSISIQFNFMLSFTYFCFLLYFVTLFHFKMLKWMK